MHTKAVYRSAQGLNDAGLVALRFNFRGVGVSTGSFDEGVGEQDDLRAALDWLESEYPTLPLVVGGFSFGSLVGLAVGTEDARVAGLLGMGLPLDLDHRYDYGFLSAAGKPILVVQGEHDEFGSGAQVQETLGLAKVKYAQERIEGKIATAVFLAGCNFRCPFCHAREIVLEPNQLESVRCLPGDT